MAWSFRYDNKDHIINQMKVAFNYSLADSFKIAIAKAMASPFASKIGINSLFILLYSYLIFPKLVMNSIDLSILFAVLPAMFVTMGIWFAFTNRVFS